MGYGIIPYLKKIRAGALLIAAVAAAVSKVVIKAQLVPEQLQWLADAGVLAAMAALVLTPALAVNPQRLRRRLILPMFIALFVIVTVRATLVEEIAISGKDYRFLVGTTLTSTGRTMEQNCLKGTDTKNLSHLPRHDLIICAGDSRIPTIYGTSYVIVAVFYTMSYMVFLGMFVVLVGSEVQHEPGARAPD